MEFERALFRVYDRSLENLRADEPCYNIRPMSCCKCIEGFILSLTLFSFILLSGLHLNYVGEHAPLCLHSELKYQEKLLKSSWATTDHPVNTTEPKWSILNKNTILQINIGEKGTKEKLLNLDEMYGSNATDLYGAGDGEFKKLYRFSENAPLLFLNDQFVKNHNIEV